MNKNYYFPIKIKNTFQSFDEIIEMYYFLIQFIDGNIDINFCNTNYLEANLAALIGAVLDSKKSFVNVNLINFQRKVQTILQKNDFLSNYGFPKLVDRYLTTIKYKKFKSTDSQLFCQYINQELLTKDDLPSMSNNFKKEFSKSLTEIFVNAYIHAKCDFVYTCGQYFPNKKYLYFTIVNTGTTIKDNVCNFYENSNISAIKAINWAVKNGSTTKKGVPGGLGLSLVRDFVKKNKGTIQIISDNAYWEENTCGIIMQEFKKSFIGTIVNLQIMMNDTQNYQTIVERGFDELFL